MPPKPVRKRAIKKPDRTALRITLLAVWFLAGLYVGIAGWTKIYSNELKRQAVQAQLIVDCNDSNGHFEYMGVSYCTMEDIAVQQYLENLENLHLGWIFYLPEPFPLLLTAFAFGAVGSTVRLLRIIIGTQKLSSFYTLSMSPVVGGMTALMLLGLSYIVPYVFSNAKIVLSPNIVPFLGLFAGAFSEHIQKWFQTVLDKIFGMKERANAA